MPNRRLRPTTALLALPLAVLFASCEHKEPAPPPTPKAEVRFGLSLDTVTLQDTVVPGGATFSQLLSRHGLTGTTTQRMVEACAGVFDVRKLRAGQPLHLAFDKTGRLRHLVYEPDALEWVRFDLDSLPRVSRQARKIDTVARSVGGTIEGSLWENLAAQGHSPALISRVSDILAYQVDFFAVQPGDEFRVLYQDLQVDGKSVGIGDIQAVSFTASGKTSEAFLFRDGGKDGYYDAEGHPCKREFLKAPLQYSRISSFFSTARLHPVLRIVRPHLGVDYAAPAGTPVMAVGDGTILARGWDPKGGGNYVKIRHNGTYATTYMHLQSIASAVRLGGHISQGQTLGWVGATGLATGPHLDFRFFRNGSPVNPLTVVPPPAPPLPENILPQYLAQIGKVQGALVAVATNFRPKPAREG